MQNSVPAALLHQLVSANPDAAKTDQEAPIRAPSTKLCTNFREEPRSGIGFAGGAGFSCFFRARRNLENTCSKIRRPNFHALLVLQVDEPDTA